MTATYTLKSGNQISIFLWGDMYEGDDWRKVAEVSTITDGVRSNKEYKQKMFKDENGLYIVWEGQKVYLSNFDFYTVDELLAKVKEGKEFVCEDKYLATFLKDTENVGFIVELNNYTHIIPFMGIALTGDSSYEVFCTPIEDRYKKVDWHYKMTLAPENQEYWTIFAKRDFYLSDLVSMIRSGHVTLVNKKSWTAENVKKREECQKQLEHDSKFPNNIAKSLKTFFGSDAINNESFVVF